MFTRRKKFALMFFSIMILLSLQTISVQGYSNVRTVLNIKDETLASDQWGWSSVMAPKNTTVTISLNATVPLVFYVLGLDQTEDFARGEDVDFYLSLYAEFSLEDANFQIDYQFTLDRGSYDLALFNNEVYGEDAEYDLLVVFTNETVHPAIIISTIAAGVTLLIAVLIYIIVKKKRAVKTKQSKIEKVLTDTTPSIEPSGSSASQALQTLKACPHCKVENPAYASICTSCSKYIG